MLGALRRVLKECWQLGLMSVEDYQRAAAVKTINAQLASETGEGRTGRASGDATTKSMLISSLPFHGIRKSNIGNLQPFSFEVIRQLFPALSRHAQVAVHAIVGGAPQYLSWSTPERSLSDNIRQSILAPASVALSEVELLLADKVRVPASI